MRVHKLGADSLGGLYTVSAVRADLRALLHDCPRADNVVICASELAANAALNSHSRLPGGTFTVRAAVLFPGKTIGTYRLHGAVRAPPSPGMEPELLGIVTKLIDGLAGRNRIDVVDDLAYPFPVAVICELLGVPHEDEPRFHAWVEKGMESLDLDPKLDPTEQQRTKAQVVAKLRLVADFLACCLVDKWIPAAPARWPTGPAG